MEILAIGKGFCPSENNKAVFIREQIFMSVAEYTRHFSYDLKGYKYAPKLCT